MFMNFIANKLSVTIVCSGVGIVGDDGGSSNSMCAIDGKGPTLHIVQHADVTSFRTVVVVFFLFSRTSLFLKIRLDFFFRSLFGWVYASFLWLWIVVLLRSIVLFIYWLGYIILVLVYHHITTESALDHLVSTSFFFLLSFLHLSPFFFSLWFLFIIFFCWCCCFYSAFIQLFCGCNRTMPIARLLNELNASHRQQM